MNRRGPKILINTKCELLVSAEDNLNIENGFVYLEFLVSDSVDSLKTLVISETPSLYRYYFNEDGLYMYYRLQIPTKTKLEGQDLFGRLYFDDSSEKLMIGAKEVIYSKQLEDVVDDDSPSASYGIVEIIEEPIFSICRISTCLENLQRRYIFEGTPTKQCKTESSKLFRDFLFASIFILRLLIRQQRYEEALRILEHVNSCSEVCELVNRSGKNSCGCR